MSKLSDWNAVLNHVTEVLDPAGCTESPRIEIVWFWDRMKLVKSSPTTAKSAPDLGVMRPDRCASVVL